MRRVNAGAFLEWAEYSGNLYGTLRAEIDRIHAAGHHAVLDIDLQGARQLRGNSAAAVEVFVLPPSGASLADRLVRRNTETAEALRRRLERAAEEILAAGEYDYVIVNDDLEHAVQQVDAIIEAESRRAHRQADLVGNAAGTPAGGRDGSAQAPGRERRIVRRQYMRIITPTEVAKQAGNKYLGVLVAAKFARYLNDFPKDHLQMEEKLTTRSLEELAEGDLNYKLVRRRRSEA